MPKVPIPLSAKDEQNFRKFCGHYNMIDVNEAVKQVNINPNAAAGSNSPKGLGKLKHDALAQGRDAAERGDLEKANNNFAFAYQCRCVCDYIWEYIIGAAKEK